VGAGAFTLVFDELCPRMTGDANGVGPRPQSLGCHQPRARVRPRPEGFAETQTASRIALGGRVSHERLEVTLVGFQPVLPRILAEPCFFFFEDQSRRRERQSLWIIIFLAANLVGSLKSI